MIIYVICMYVCKYMYMYVCMHRCVSITVLCVYICVYVCMYACMNGDVCASMKGLQAVGCYREVEELLHTTMLVANLGI